MASLIENVLMLEGQADEVVLHARAEAERVMQQAREEAAAGRQQVQTELEARMGVFEQQAQLRHEAELASAQQELKQALQRTDEIQPAVIDAQIGRIVARFREC